MFGGNDNSISFAQRIRIRCFLEGVEIPVIAANITATPNSPSVCSLQIPPLVEGTRLLPRTLVHVFFQDAYETANPFLVDSAVAGKTDGDETDPTAREAANTTVANPTQVIAAPGPCGDNRNKDWQMTRFKLCFVGEVVGFTWTKTPMNRSLLLQCEDLSNYWDYAYQWDNTGIFGPGMKAMFSGGATNLFTDFLSSSGSVLANIILSGKCNTFPNLQGLAAGIVRLVESIGGSYYVPSNKKGLKKFAGQNTFFSIAELRLHITQMITAYEFDETSKRLLSRGGYDGMFNRTLGGLGSQVSIRKAMAAITRTMFHETYPQPCPRYIKGTGTDPSGSERIALINDKDGLAQFAIYAKNCAEALRDVEDEFSLYRGLSKADFKQQEGAARTSLGFQGQVMKSMSETLKRQQTQIKPKNGPEQLESLYIKASRALAQASQQVPRWYPNNASDKSLVTLLGDAIQALDQVAVMTVNRPKGKQQIPARLVQQILRPDIWFGAPPRCNVLFPDMYTQLNYQRMFLQEPTRFMLKTNDEFFGEDFLFDKFYFAPQAGSLQKDKARMSDMLKNDILDHELFTGILPVFEKMGEFNVFAARSNREQAGKVVKVSYAQRSANFLYFKHRFNARQFQVEARFNPYVAVGFPGVIIDKWVDQKAANAIRAIRDQFIQTDPGAREQILPEYTAELMGTNFLANFVEVSHSLSQASLLGNTSIRCNYARQVEESAEFFGIEDSKEVQRRQEGDARRTTIVAAVSAPDLYSLGPNQGQIVGRQEVTDKYVVRDIDQPGFLDTSGQNLPVFFTGARRAGGTNKYSQLKVPVGVRLTPKDLPAADKVLLSDFLGGDDKEVVFRAFSIEEDIPRYRLERVALPVEELIRPGWYGDIWGPGRIGEVYKDFFGIGSITEPTVILDGGGSSSEALQQAIAEAQKAEDADSALVALPTVTSLREGSTISQAVEFLTLTYSYVKQAGLDADEFIRAYTWRPIATMFDMYGSTDLTFDSRGIAALTGVEGFHSRAFGPYADLFGLVTPEVDTLLGIKRGSVTAQKGDTRMRKRQAALTLQSALSFGTAQVG
jgi:hypothetical protein